MINFIINKLIVGFLIILASISSLYIMIHMVPGDPVKVLLGPRATVEMQEAVSIKLGLDDPIFIQIFNFISNIFKGDLGNDILTQRSVLTIILEQTPHTIALVIVSIGWAILIGIPLGCYNAIYQNSFSDKLSGIFTVSFIAIPPFVIGFILFTYFCCVIKMVTRNRSWGVWRLNKQIFAFNTSFNSSWTWVGWIPGKISKIFYVRSF